MNDRKAALVMACMMVVCALAYIICIDMLVLHENSMTWANLSTGDVLALSAPADSLVIYAVIMVCYYHHVEHKCSPYSGSKYSFL